MIKFHKLCVVCDQIKASPKLGKDIFNSRHFLKGSSVTLKDIFNEYQSVNGAQFSYNSLLNHCRKHQFLSDEDFTSRQLKKISRDAQQIAVKKAIDSVQVWDEVINQGMEKLANGEIHMRTGDLLKAAKDKSDHQLKIKDQELVLAQMVYHFASGENETNLRKPYDRRTIEGEAVTDFDPTDVSAGDTEQGEDRPSDVYYPPAWDASPPRAS